MGAVVFDKETGGIPAEVEAMLDTIATVPQVDTGCLNVSHAIAITAYERRRQLQKGHVLYSDRLLSAAACMALCETRRRIVQFESLFRFGLGATPGYVQGSLADG